MSISMDESSLSDLAAKFADRDLFKKLAEALAAIGYDETSEVPIGQFIRAKMAETDFLSQPANVEAVRAIPNLIRTLKEEESTASDRRLDDTDMPGADREMERFREAVAAGTLRRDSLGSFLLLAQRFFGDRSFTSQSFSQAVHREPHLRMAMRDVLRSCVELEKLGLLESSGEGLALCPRISRLEPSNLLDLCTARIGDLSRTLGWSFQIPKDQTEVVKRGLDLLFVKLESGSSLASEQHPKQFTTSGDAPTVLAPNQRVCHPEFGVGRVKFINGRDSSVVIAFSSPTVRHQKFALGETDQLRIIENSEEAEAILEKHKERLLNLIKLWPKVSDYVHPDDYYSAKALIGQCQKDQPVSFAEANKLEGLLRRAQRRAKLQGESILGFGVFEVLMMDRELTDPLGPRMVVNASRIIERFGCADFERFVQLSFDGAKCKPELIARLVDQDIKGIRAKINRNGGEVNIEEVERKAADRTAHTIAVVERFAHAQGLVPDPVTDRVGRFHQRSERYMSLRAQLRSDLAEMRFQSEVDGTERRYQAVVLRSQEERVELVQTIRAHWEKGEPVHDWATRGEALGPRARRPFVFGSHAALLRAAGIPDYFIREESGKHNSGILAPENCLMRLTRHIDSDGNMDCRKIAEDPALFISVYHHFGTLLEGAKRATGEDGRLPALPQVDLVAVRFDQPSDSIPQVRSLLFAVSDYLRRTKGEPVHQVAISRDSEIRECRLEISRSARGNLNASLVIPDRENGEAEQFFDLLKSRGIPLELRRQLLQKCVPLTQLPTEDE